MHFKGRMAVRTRFFMKKQLLCLKRKICGTFFPICAISRKRNFIIIKI